MGPLSTQNARPLARSSAAELTCDSRVRQALAKLGADAEATTEEQIRITEIPAPPFQEAKRAAYMGKLLGCAGLEVHTDEAGNVIGESAGAEVEDVVLVAAHLDTVFPPGTDVRVRREGGRIYGPGISDNGAGLAALVAIAQAMHAAKVKTRSTILFAADVGEEGEGNLRGMRKLVENYRQRLRYVIALDGAATDYVTTAALGSHRVEISVSGPGGHSWSDFGTPNPVNALARGITRFLRTPIPEAPRTTFNIGEITGGSSVNVIPSSSAIKADLRSESEIELARIEAALRDAIQAGVQEEMAASRARRVCSPKPLAMEVKVLGIRPGGQLPERSPLLAAVRAADEAVGNRSRAECSSTDANIPLSMGIPAIALGAGGRSGGAHSAEEWYEPAGRDIGLRRALLTILKVAELRPSHE